MVKNLKNILFFALSTLFFLYGIFDYFLISKELSFYATSVIALGLIMAILQLVFFKKEKYALVTIFGAIKYLYSFGISLLPLTALISALGQTPSQHLVINGIIVISVLLAAIIILAVLEYIMIRKSAKQKQ
ncbi:MAG: hypothetical protein GX756_05975 [Clostridiales bacterium]|nr:hypothetical protein [Clostridiales bacterium]